MRGSWKVVPHTAEVGLELAGPDWPAFYEAAAYGLLELYGARPKPKGEEARSLSLHAEAPEDLLVSWLNELIYLVATKRWIPLRVRVEKAEATRLAAELEGSPMPEGVRLIQEIKAATFGGLAVRGPGKGGPWARVILDV